LSFPAQAHSYYILIPLAAACTREPAFSPMSLHHHSALITDLLGFLAVVGMEPWSLFIAKISRVGGSVVGVILVSGKAAGILFFFFLCHLLALLLHFLREILFSLTCVLNLALHSIHTVRKICIAAKSHSIVLFFAILKKCFIRTSTMYSAAGKCLRGGMN
jgi:hypothetical protein